MTPAWSTVRAVFEEVVDLPPAERAAAVAARCAGDDAVRADVERLLRADTDAARVVSADRVAAAVGPTDDPLGGAGPVQIAGFTVRRLLGSGGMGAVYEAEQDQPRRLVALKVLRPELCTGRTLRRFAVEAEILGRLQHPGIAEVFAAGVHRADAGPFRWDVPWYAMELLAGARPITDHARAHGLTVPQRLDLLRLVCGAVHHAHQRGVIHRDLKPGNVLVDAEGKPRVIDFGVARAVGKHGQPESLHTAAGVLVGTPSYMAPEQIAGSDDLDVRCDVWALGVLLYELVCDRLPFAPDTRTPATASLTFATPPPSPRRLRSDLSAELEWIVLKALAVERERRYQTAAELADDLERLRRHDSVHAAPPSRIYRLRKAVRRHRTLAASVTVAFVCLCAGLVSTSLALRRARAAETTARSAESAARAAAATAVAEKERADLARAEAETSAASAEKSKQRGDAMLDIIQGAVTAASRRDGGRNVTLAQLWEQMAARAEAEGTMAPAMRAAAFNYLGAISFYAGDYVRAEQYLVRSLALLETAGTLGAREEMAAQGSLSEASRMLGKYDASEAALDRALAIAADTLTPGDPQTLSMQRRRTHVLLTRGRNREALANSRELLAAHLARPEPDAQKTAEARLDLAGTLLACGEHAACEAEARAAHAACCTSFGADSARTAHAANLWAQGLLALGRAPEAATVVRQALDAAHDAVPAAHPTLRDLRRVLAVALRRTGDHRAAIALFSECLASAQGAPGIEPREILALASGLAAAHLAAGDPERAAEVAAAHDTDDDAAPAIEQQERLRVQLEHARALVALHRTGEGVALLEAALQRGTERLGEEHSITKDLRAELVRVRAQ